MTRPKYEIADIIKRFGNEFIASNSPNVYQQRVLRALEQCRTASLGGHKEVCDCCGKERISYNSCGNRHCPKCQATRQTFWVEDLIDITLPVKHYHLVFTIPHELNSIVLLDSKWFYNRLFEAVWSTLRTFGYSHFGIESGALCVLHTWGQNLSLHPHIHSLVPATGLSLAGNMKHIGKSGKYLYPVTQLSRVFRGKLMALIKKELVEKSLFQQYETIVNDAWRKPWNVHCEPAFGKPEHVIKYLGKYSHRVAISNHRIINITQKDVTFLHKDYRDNAKQKPVTLSGIEFLRRFCQHILPKGFVKIRYYGIYSSKFRTQNASLISKMVIKPKETSQERLKRLTGFDLCKCPFCKTGNMHVVEILPRVRSPTALFACTINLT
jgi:hypothetical protein